jgi:1-acyl-sn-glycerol-3-phosphate acyltransferase
MFIFSFIRVLYRFIGFLLMAFICGGAAATLKLLGYPYPVVFKAFKFWRKSQMVLMNVKMELQGNAPDKAGILMSNHRSYLDVILLPSDFPYTFVAKASVRKWPLIGWGASVVNTVWVNRQSKESRKETREQLQKRLEQNQSVVIFPEGTTHKGPEVLPFKPGMFHTVAQGGFPIIAAAIEYRDPDVAFVDDDLFIPHFFKVFGRASFPVKVRYSEAFYGEDGDELRKRVHSWVSEQCLQFRKEWDDQQD